PSDSGAETASPRVARTTKRSAGATPARRRSVKARPALRFFLALPAQEVVAAGRPADNRPARAGAGLSSRMPAAVPGELRGTTNGGGAPVPCTQVNKAPARGAETACPGDAR